MKQQWTTASENARTPWSKLNAIYARLVSAYEKKDRLAVRRLRARLLYTIKHALRRAEQKGRLLAALGEATSAPDRRLSLLQQSYHASKKEKDAYNCFLVADSLAEFFVERRFNRRLARYWIGIAQGLQESFSDDFTKEHLLELSTKANGPAPVRTSVSPHH
jgi:hypothetical protein